jgi:hypothetical protein
MCDGRHDSQGCRPPRPALGGIRPLKSATGPRPRAQSARFDQFAETSPKAGEMAPDFDLLTLDNDPFNLMEAAAEKPLVIEFGSFT